MGLDRLRCNIRDFLRITFVLLNNLYCIPTHALWLFTLWPVRFILPKCWLRLESIGFEWLLSMVSAWSYTAGYNVAETGDNIDRFISDRALVLINHQSTSDVPLIMAALDGHRHACSKVMWIMDRMFKKTNFGLVSWLHQDFFISSGQGRREESLLQLTRHMREVYVSLTRSWILLFPEGGFLRKRREVSQKFAVKNNLPHLQHVTVPRVGAVQNIVTTLDAVSASNNSQGESNSVLKWVIDLTIAYPNGKPLDLLTILRGTAPPCTTLFHYKVYPLSEVPRDKEALTNWVYERFYEKEAMLDIYYKTGKFPDHHHPGQFCSPRPVLHDGVRYLALNGLYLASTWFHWNLLTSLFTYLFY